MQYKSNTQDNLLNLVLLVVLFVGVGFIFDSLLRYYYLYQASTALHNLTTSIQTTSKPLNSSHKPFYRHSSVIISKPIIKPVLASIPDTLPIPKSSNNIIINKECITKNKTAFSNCIQPTKYKLNWTH